MAVWNHVGATPQEMMDKNTRAIENGEQPEELKTFATNMNTGELNDVLWLVSFDKVRRVLKISTKQTAYSYMSRICNI